ncbi:MAG: terpene cyclase/mutase family protein [Lachnospiraceae bacterium]|nr:terpene cyclase/mutase family protein [Lachnospiraceae bacterium]
MKKILTWILLINMCVLLAACGDKASADKTAGEAGSKADKRTESIQNEQTIKDSLEQTGNYLYKNVENPTIGSVGGEWTILGLARSGMDIRDEYFETYFENLSAYTAQQGGVLHAKKYTEYSRVILTVTAIDKDPSDVGGFDMLAPLADFEQTVFQGVNGPAFALLALDAGNYEIPENTVGSTQATRELYVDHIINAQLPDGGWSIGGAAAEVDLTAMVLQALAKYQDRKDVEEAVEKGLKVLSESQNENGGYGADMTESSESVSQVIVALTELGISLEDSGFVKKGNTLLDALAQFRLEDGSYSHLKGEESNLLATEQAFYALVSAERANQGEASLYRMK